MPPARSLAPAGMKSARALALIADGKDINYNGLGGDVELMNTATCLAPSRSGPLDGDIQSTGRFELP